MIRITEQLTPKRQITFVIPDNVGLDIYRSGDTFEFRRPERPKSNPEESAAKMRAQVAAFANAIEEKLRDREVSTNPSISAQLKLLVVEKITKLRFPLKAIRK